jgi:hypothetical protein
MLGTVPAVGVEACELLRAPVAYRLLRGRGMNVRSLVIPLLLIGAAPAVAGDTTTDIAPGIKLLSRTTTSPNERIYVATTSLCEEGTRIEARSAQSTRITPEAWGTALGAKIATNGDFFRTDRTTPTVYGDAVGLGTRWPTAQTGLLADFSGDWYYGHYGWIAFGDGWVELNHTGYVKDHAAELGITQGFHGAARTTEIPPGTEALVSGFPELVVEGQVATTFPDRGDCADRNPRTAMGLSEDRSTFFLVTVDGRSTSSVGMTCAELAVLMHGLGAYTAFNLDGGGSTQMYVEGRGTINQFSDPTERAVANEWGMFSDGAVPAKSCFKAGGCFPSAVPEAAGSHFGDLPDDAPAASIAALAVDRGYIAPCQADPAMFCPSCGITRRDAIALVVRAAGLDLSAPPSTPTFADVPADAPAFAEIEAAASAGLTTGCGGGKLCPDDVVTRGEVASLIARARHWPSPAAPPALSDVPSDHAFYSEIEAVAGNCVASACAEGAFCPDDPAVRSDAVMLVGAAFALSDSGACTDPDSVDDPMHHSGCAAAGGTGTIGVLWALALIALRPRRRAVRTQ